MPRLSSGGGSATSAGVRHFALSFCDQALSSAGNFALSVLVARRSSVTEFGAFALVYLTYQLVLGLSRATGSEPLLVRMGGVSDPRVRAGSARLAMGWCLSVGSVAGAAGVLLALALRMPGWTSLLWFSLLLPVLLAQDLERHVAIAERRPGLACVADGGWALALLGPVLLLPTWFPSAASVTALWGLGGAASSVGLALALGGVRREPRAATRWWRDSRQLIRGFGTEFLLVRSGFYAVTYGLIFLVGLEAVAGFRGASLLMNPVAVLFTVVAMTTIPQGMRDGTATELWRNGRATASLLALSSLIIGALLLVVPDDVGRAILGATWPSARDALPGLIVWTAGTGATFGPMICLRVLGAVRGGVVARAWQSIAVLVGGLCGGALGGGPGAAMGVAGGVWFGFVVWCREAHRTAQHAELLAERPLAAPSEVT